jgi:hypothetical protein
MQRVLNIPEKSHMSQKAKMDFAATDKMVAGQNDVENPEATAPALAPEPVVTKQPPPDDTMVQQILERQAVFGF